MKKNKKKNLLKGYEEIKKREINILKKMSIKESIKLTEILLKELSKWKR
ncbi:MAG: hypothetical protein ABIM49_06095 [candidate division WOR-3 bacterium]